MESLHLIPLRTNGRKAPLFCFPGAGGEIFVFNDMAAVMDEQQPIYAVNMRPFYESRANFDIKELAAFYCRVIRDYQQRGPYYLCGYSFGGLVAYEMATILASEGEEIGLVALLDAANPALQSSLSIGDAIQFRATYVSNRIAKYARNLFRCRIDLFLTDAFAFISPRVGPKPWLLVQSVFRMLNRPLPELLQNNDPILVAATRAYDPTPYTKRLVLIRSEGRGPEYDKALTLGWDRSATGPIDVHVMPGSHVNMMAKPQVAQLAEKLARYLDNCTTALGS
jgi:thioesterase domain-containing protein